LVFFDAALLRAEGRHFAAIVAVPHVVLIEDVVEPVRLGAALERHHIDASERGIFALGALRAGVVEVERERDHLALTHQLRGGDDVFGRRVVERADLVLRAPFAPVLVLLGGLAKVLPGDLSARHETSLQGE
jgi:hypothetical protein